MTTLAQRGPEVPARHDGRRARRGGRHDPGNPRAALPARLARRRRRLLLASAPVVALLVVLAARLLSLNLVHDQTLAAYTSGTRATTLTWAERQGWVNVAEPFRAPFALGDAQVIGGHFDLARPHFEEAFELVPKGGIEDCKVRVNLGLTYEALGDAAKARERTTEWRQFYDKGIAITRDRPPLCDAPEGGETGQQLQETEQRLEQKNSGDQQSEEPAPAPPQTPPAPEVQPTPDPDNTPSQQQQDLLQEQQRQNTIERNLERGEGDRSGSDTGQTYPKPW